jgi:uncharacterized protein YjbI with pentapeptide repeats
LLGTNLENANIRGARFVYSKLDGANLANARMDGVNLSHASMVKTWIGGTDLSQVTGLTQDQIGRACANAKTRLPPALKPHICPRQWVR